METGIHISESATYIRLATADDLLSIQAVYAVARRFMAATGNPNQWSANYPSDEVLLMDVQKQQLYVEESDGSVHAVFVLAMGDDPTYAYIENGKWLSDEPYGTIHRIASDGYRTGFFQRCLSFCCSRIAHLRIDTHRDNAVMQHLVEKAGFRRCGIIYLANGSPRIAYELAE